MAEWKSFLEKAFYLELARVWKSNYPVTKDTLESHSLAVQICTRKLAPLLALMVQYVSDITLSLD